MNAGEATNEERLALLEAHREAVLAGLESTARNLELLSNGRSTSTRRSWHDHEPAQASGPGGVAIGLGCMGMSAFYGSTDEDEGVKTIRRARELGVTLLDTAQAYGPLTNEILVGRAIKGHRDEYVIATSSAAVWTLPSPAT